MYGLHRHGCGKHEGVWHGMWPSLAWVPAAFAVLWYIELCGPLIKWTVREQQHGCYGAAGSMLACIGGHEA